MSYHYLNIRQSPVYQMAFFVFIAMCSFLPIPFASTELLGHKVQLTVLGCVGLLFVCVPLVFVKHHSAQARITFGLFFFVLSWSLISMLWSSYFVDSGLVMYPLLMAFLTMAIPYLVTKAEVDIPRMLTWFTFIMTAALVYYLLRFYQGSLYVAGENRLSGYIGGASVLHIIMVPMLAVCVANMIEKRRRLLSLLCAVAITFSILSTQSRAGLIGLGLFAVFLLLNNASSIKRVLVMLVPIGTAAWLIQQYGPTDRYGNYEDVLRTMTREIALSFAFQSPGSFLFGNGFGSIWPYYAVEKKGAGSGLVGLSFLIDTQKGVSLYHPHSVFLEILSELGVLCLLAFIILLFIIVRELLRSRKVKRHHMKTYVLAGIICSFPALYVDLYFFKNWLVSIVWWFYLFAALSLMTTSRKA